LDYPASLLGLDKPVIAGELDPRLDDFDYKLDTLNNNGYDGGFFWEDESPAFILTDSDFDEIEDWFTGQIIIH